MMWLCVGFLICFILQRTASSMDINACNRPLGMQDGRIKDNQLSASSYKSYMYISRLSRSYNTYARYGRLNNKLPWCGLGPYKHIRPVSYFQVDFDEMVNVTGLATQGYYNLDDYYVKTYTLGFSLNGDDWFDYSAPNKIWSGNKNGNSVKKNEFDKSVRTRYLRIYPQEYYTYICLRVEVYGCRLSDDVKSSSIFGQPTVATSSVPVTAEVVATATETATPTMVTKATVHRTATMITKPTIPTRTSVVAKETTVATTKESQNTPTAKPANRACNRPLGMQDGRIKDNQLSASSYKSYMYISRLSRSYNTYARYGRLNNKLPWCGLGPYKHIRPVSYFQVDFDEMVNVTGLATQGYYNLGDYYVKTYTLGFSLNGDDWFDYSAPNKVWSGNKNANSINRVLFSKPIRTRYLRIYPQKYSIYRCLRAEVYGCRLSEDDKSSTNSTTSTRHSDIALFPSTQMTSPMTSATRIPTPAISQPYNTADISRSKDVYILTIQPTSSFESPSNTNTNAGASSMGISPSSPSTQALSSQMITAKRISSSVLQYKVVFLLGVCVGCGVLVVVTILVFMWLKRKTGQGTRGAQRFRNLELECRMGENQ